MNVLLPFEVDRIQRRALLVGVVVMAFCVVGAFFEPEQFFHSYLFAFMFWLGIALGSLAIVMLNHLTNGGWGFVIGRLLESGSGTTPLMALFAIPILGGLRWLYAWSHPPAGVTDELLAVKLPYLNIPFFLIRTALYFAVWIALSYFMNKWSREQDRGADPRLVSRMKTLSGPGLVAYVLTITFASIDWIMSLEPHWYSTSFGLLITVGQVLNALAFSIALAMLMAHREPLSKVISKARLRDLGNLLLTFVMLWAYISFSQFLIIWAGNLPHEIVWYRHRFDHGWGAVAVILLLFHFAVPFMLLLSRDVKHKTRRLAFLAGALILMRFVDLFWIVIPSYQSGFAIHLMDILVPVGMGGIWIAVFLAQLKKRPLLPLNDPILSQELKAAES